MLLRLKRRRKKLPSLKLLKLKKPKTLAKKHKKDTLPYPYALAGSLPVMGATC